MDRKERRKAQLTLLVFDIASSAIGAGAVALIYLWVT